MPLRPFILLLALLVLSVQVQAQELLRHAAEVRALPPDRALAGVPAELEVVVGFIESPSSGTVFVQDETGGTYFRVNPHGAALKVGDRVRLRGKSVPGLYLAGVEAQSYEVIGTGEPPIPVTADYEDLASGRYHYQRVQVEGIGRQLSVPEENRTILHLALGSRVIEVRVDAPLPEAMDDYVDAKLQITALAAGGINDRRQLVFPYLRVTDWSDVKILKAAPAIQDLGIISAARLLRFDPSRTQEFGHRVRTTGIVLAAFPDGQVFLRDLDQYVPVPTSSKGADKASVSARPAALAVRLAKPYRLLTGQQVDVAGFPNMLGFSASLVDAVPVNEPSGTEQAVVPVNVTVKEIMEGNLDADLVTLEAQMVDAYRTAAGWELRLLSAEQPLKALVPGFEPSELVKPGALLKLTGICRVESSTDKGFRSRPDRAMLLLRGPEDLIVLRAPSWWTVERLIGLVALLLAVVAIGVLWITLLRRQVVKQGEALRRRISHEAVLEERQRIAREFHDTLEQELAGLSLRLDAAVTRPLEDKAKGLLESSRHLVSRVQTEARNLVADLRAEPDSVTDLPAALQELADRTLSDSLHVSVHVLPPLPNLPVHVAHHLRMIAQEAVTNVLKHAQASSIALGLRVEDGKLCLTISDDGVGVEAVSTQGQKGHFGCMGIRERCQRIGASVEWLNVTPHGTQVQVHLPLSAL
ncbi:Histidine kinase-, DNA gyrase B-, and HSP90-like ATPase [Prosthecobacter debontii]|uniref:Histidine kinase-, DNA gyrase B-, and HSP90-like ATPase n=1 Tax=Prosthecobacter debontii TaxID=48467 RepID=A0A1T4Y9F6_9BACT|nr:histidine kinase [Prosthecobacter debontii]SKA98409.1 Histidine kinase-, DNA gyrase B-, and HSP90-like ATPase [Prosthecobacter debontii]